MSNDSLVIRYENDVPARDGRRAFLAGEEYAVADASAAATHHPDATIIGHLDGKPYTPKTSAARVSAAAPEGAQDK